MQTYFHGCVGSLKINSSLFTQSKFFPQEIFVISNFIKIEKHCPFSIRIKMKPISFDIQNKRQL